VSVKAAFSDWVQLTKARLIFLALLMAWLGYVMGKDVPLSTFHFAASMIGIAFLGGASGILNQYIERDLDRRMRRTAQRPLPGGRVSPRLALAVGIATSLTGLLILVAWVNIVTAILGALTLFFYLAIYTPSKRLTSLSTLLGAIPGAMPPLMGFTAAHGSLAVEGFLLFGILFLWQIPHFLAIAWIYRDDYAKAGFPILTVVDEAGVQTVKQVLLYSMILLPVSLIPAARGLTGNTYFFGAFLLGLVFVAFGVSLAVFRSKPHARRLFLVSILYLPALGVLMAWDKR
jgi:protoheme IX farnesyltransferase